MMKKSLKIILVVVLIVTVIGFIYVNRDRGEKQKILTRIQQISDRKIKYSSVVSNMYYQAIKKGDSQDYVHRLIADYSSSKSGSMIRHGKNYTYEEYSFKELDGYYLLIITYDENGLVYHVELT